MLSEISRLAIPVRNRSYRLIVIPAKAGIHASNWRWIPAFPGMTMCFFSAIRQHEALYLC
jgi:hypothetical protein